MLKVPHANPKRERGKKTTLKHTKRMWVTIWERKKTAGDEEIKRDGELLHFEAPFSPFKDTKLIPSSYRARPIP